jgi:hypothetical protein
MSDDSLTVSIYPSGCGEDEVHIEGNVYECKAVLIPINRICKPLFSTTVNKIEMTHNTTVSIKTNILTIFVPSAFYLIS